MHQQLKQKLRIRPLESSQLIPNAGPGPPLLIGMQRTGSFGRGAAHHKRTGHGPEDADYAKPIDGRIRNTTREKLTHVQPTDANATAKHHQQGGIVLVAEVGLQDGIALVVHIDRLVALAFEGLLDPAQIIQRLVGTL